LSLEKTTAAFLKRHCEEKYEPSLSACVEHVIAAYRRSVEIGAVSDQVTAYYDSLSPREQAEEAAWGVVGEAALNEEKTAKISRVRNGKRR